ncbi:MAG: ArsR family transcriptional regulator [Clostridia bacterium]|nr:ArsR family transcriptional regulator [Clostridia bacterium]
MELYKHQNADAYLSIENEEDIPLIACICDALGDTDRLKILRQLQEAPYLKTIAELKKLTGLPKTTLIRHLQKLEEANIVSVLYRSSAHGMARVFQRDMRKADISLYFKPKERKKDLVSNTQTLRVGHYADFHGEAFGYATSNNTHHFATEDCFNIGRYDAELVYATSGRITYYFGNKAAKYNKIKQLDLSFEICSEAPYYDNDYMSDITVWLNGVETANFTCDGDYGDRRGKLNPDWWPDHDTQYGKLVTITVNDEGVFINGSKSTAKVTLKDLKLNEDNKIIFTLGNKDTATHLGGFNLFGRKFGDFEQDITLTMQY